MQLMTGAAEVLSRMPHDQITPWFRHLCSLQSAPLLKVCVCVLEYTYAALLFLDYSRKRDAS